MPKTLAEVISNLAGKGKVDLADPKWANALSAPDLTTLTIPDELFEAIDNSLLSMEAARGNHPDIKPHYMAMAYDGLDKELNAAASEYKFTEEEIAQLKGEKSSTKRAVLLSRLAAAKEAKKHANGNVDKEKYAKEIADLNEAIRLEKASTESIRQEYEGKLREQRMGFAKTKLLADYKTIHDHLPGNIKQQIIDAQIAEALRENNARFDIDDQGNIQLLRADGNPVYSPNNTPFTPKAFVDKVLSDNKQLKINDQTPPPANPGANQRYQNPGQQPAFQVPGKQTANSTAQQRNLEAIAALESAGAKGAML